MSLTQLNNYITENDQKLKDFKTKAESAKKIQERDVRKKESQQRKQSDKQLKIYELITVFYFFNWKF